MKKILAVLLFFPAFANLVRAQSDGASAAPKGGLDAFLSEPINPVLLEGYNQKIRDSSTNYKRRFQRSLILLKHGEYGPPTSEDIDTLLRHSDWNGEGRRLQAIRLYLLGRTEDSKTLIRQNIRDNVHEHEQARFLAALELSAKDTAAALAAYQMTWDLYKDENVYVDWLYLYQAKKQAPEELLQRGLGLYPHSPGPIQAIFEVYYTTADSASLRKCEEISGRAETVLWPRSVDWKLRHAKALMALKRTRDAETVLLKAMDLMEEDPRLRTNSDDSPAQRQEIFTLLEAARQQK